MRGTSHVKRPQNPVRQYVTSALGLDSVVELVKESDS